MVGHPDEVEVFALGGEPVEFVWCGRRYRIHAVLLRWCEAGGMGQVMANTDQIHEDSSGSWRMVCRAN